MSGHSRGSWTGGCPDLPGEERIVWLEDITRLDYVRQAVVYAGTRRRRVRWDVGRLVGYAVLRPDATGSAPGTFERRAFWVAAHDRDSEPSGVYRSGAPSEAVDPRTIAPGEPGELTDRAWGCRPASGFGDWR